jgi:hypothetical protein
MRRDKRLERVALVAHVAAWDWSALGWSLPSWLPAVDEVVVCWERRGKSWRSDRSFEFADNLRDAFGELEDWMHDNAPAVPVRSFVYDRPPGETEGRDHWAQIEAPIRNAATFVARGGSWILSPDCDEWCLDPLAVRAELLELGDVGLAMAYRHDVLRVDVERGVALVSHQPTRQLRVFGVPRPGIYQGSRGIAAARRVSAVEVVHWRARAGVVAGLVGVSESYLGDGFHQWMRTVEAGPVAPGTWQTDGAQWTEVREVPLGEVLAGGVVMPEGGSL